jgi:hypothetical protein
MVREIVSCVVDSTGTVVTEWIFEGEYKPEIGAAKGGNLNGTSAGNPSALRFNGASTGALHSAAVGEHTYSGLLKYLGYYHQDVFAVKP